MEIEGTYCQYVIAMASKTCKIRVSQRGSVAQVQSLQDAVAGWFVSNQRTFPWRDTRNAFHIFVAEVLLRQTQAERVVDPYLDLVAAYPNAEAMASADVDELRQWFGPLGLVRRADNLVSAATIILRDYHGAVPNDLDALLALPGVGAYSARAVLCLAYDQRIPMIDESSGRLLRRVLGLPSRGPAYCDHQLLRRAAKIVPIQHAKEFNLGLLDIAARYCRPIKSLCVGCPLRSCCSHAHKSKS